MQRGNSAQFKNPPTSGDSESDVTGEEASGYEDEDQSVASSSSTLREDEESDVSNDSGPVRKKRRKSQTSKGTIYKKGTELWREGVRTGLGPGRQVIIAKPKARPAGKIPYADNHIHPNTMLFLQDLAKNNDREWLKSKSILQARRSGVVLAVEPAYKTGPLY